MSIQTISLVVIRSNNLLDTLTFYQALGLSFVEEQHGTGPLHYACDLGGVIVELYAGKPGVAPDRRQGGATMLGFQVLDLNATLTTIRALDSVVITEPQTTPWGRRALVQDPDGRAIDLSEPLL